MANRQTLTKRYAISSCAVVALSAMAEFAWSQGGVDSLPRTFLGRRGATGAVVAPVAPLTPAPASNPELDANQQVREESLQWMERRLKLGASGGFQTAPEKVADRVAGMADTSLLSGDLGRFANAAKQLAATKKQIDSGLPPAADRIMAVVNDFETALDAVSKLKAETDRDKIAADLLKIAIKTIDTKDLKAGNILPALIKGFLAQLGLDSIFGDAAPQALPPNPTASQVVFRQLLDQKGLSQKVAKLKE